MPTPVSALIHAATMVTAGVFLILRCSVLFELAHTILLFLLMVGGFTSFISGTIGVVQFDMKKVIAYSTCSQLGYMVLACGSLDFLISFFHLVNHAFFKALLFLCAGCVIHSCSGEQDFRAFGGLSRILPVTLFIMLVGSLALGGFAFLTGFYSKDFVLEQFLYSSVTYNLNFFWSYASICLILASVFTAFYTFRLIASTFVKMSGFYFSMLHALHESSTLMLYPLALLFLGSVFFGYNFQDIFIGIGNSFSSDLFFSTPTLIFLFETELIATCIKLVLFLVLCLISIAAVVGLFPRLPSFFNSILYKKSSRTPNFFLVHSYVNYFILFNAKWFFDCVYNRFINYNTFRLAYYTGYELIDKILLERFFGHFNILISFSHIFKLIKGLFQNGSILFFFVFFFFSLFIPVSTILCFL